MTRLCVLIALVGCGGTSLKSAGQQCSASSECASGLLCDTTKDPPICDTEISIDATVRHIDASIAPVDAEPADAHKPDARPDARPDAPLDAAPDAPAD